MSNVKQKVAYLQGLVDGLNVQDETQRKIYAAILDVMNAVSDTLDYQDESIDDLEESMIELYEEMDEIEEELEFALDELDNEFDDEDDEDFEFIEVQCPHCDDVVFFDQDMLINEHVRCPSCKQRMFPELEHEEDDE